ncbi:MAG: DUF2441 domain-containing protein [Clostridia bacterium]|nr:DUF2441 domain-containing protein [Clostridia bacterium]
MIAYHVVTDRPMHAGQIIRFDDTHHSGVYERVQQRLPAVLAVYAGQPDTAPLDHHTRVALRELALEEVRAARFPQYPSRLSCLYVSRTLEEAERWAAFFARIGRPTYHIVRVETDGRVFEGNACLCFDGTTDREENLRLAARYWEAAPTGEPPVTELLIDGSIRVLEIVREIHANLP